MNEKQWYLVQTYNGMENAVKRNLERRIVTMNMTDLIFDVLVPEVITKEKKKNGETKDVVTRPYSGYVFINMIMTDETWFMVRNTPMVTGFLGSSGGGTKPVPLTEEEMGPILKMCGISTEKVFEGSVGGKVRIAGGSFTGLDGVIDVIDTQRGVVKVLIEGFGGAASVELQYDEVTLI